ncbi:MAG TPA: GreA/GreB family elongation factor [Burkholderiales bacterium]|nr:GreA/GreB family elongation factor [Burkholderiales bacterium]
MSRAFVKEQDDKPAIDELPERPQSPHPNYITPKGYAQLQERCQALLKQRSALAADSDDPLAAQQLKQVERDLRYFQGRLERAIVVDPTTQPAGEVHFGAGVSVRDENGDAHEFTIVGEDEADAAIGKVSWDSPLAHAMIGARVGDNVVWKRPAGELELEIIAIRYASD